MFGGPFLKVSSCIKMSTPNHILIQLTSPQTYLERYDLEVVGALALICTLHEMSIPEACLKWPNDVWVKGHKIAGFLAEHGGPLPGKSKTVLNFTITADHST